MPFMILDKRHSAGFDQQVHVVAHKDIGIHLEAVPLPVLLQPLQVILPIPITAKNRLPLIAPTDHMIKRPANSTLGFRAMVPHYPFTSY
jgi:hypothetical protein